MQRPCINRLLRSERGSLPLWEGIALKLVSFLLALILWITFLGLKRDQMSLQVKLEPLLAPGMIITNRIPSVITFTFSGPRLLLKGLHKRIEPIRPDFRKNRESTIGFTIGEELLSGLPGEIRTVGFSPTSVLIRLEEVVERYVKVSPTLVGRPGAGYEIASLQVSPNRVLVSGPRSALNRVDSIGTEPIDIMNFTGDMEARVNTEVDQSQGFRLPDQSGVVVKLRTRRVPR